MKPLPPVAAADPDSLGQAQLDTLIQIQNGAQYAQSHKGGHACTWVPYFFVQQWQLPSRGHKVVHGDIKPPNMILLPNAQAKPHRHLKVIDFGMAGRGEMRTMMLYLEKEINVMFCVICQLFLHLSNFSGGPSDFNFLVWNFMFSFCT